jgi:translation initiation factor IF-3
VRLVGPNGEQVGIVAINDALRLAQESDLDLVEVAPTARPPVAKLMDYGKFKYESALKARESRKHQAQTVIKEIKLRPKIDPHDYGTKKGHVERFLRQGDKVKVTIMFRGREQSRPDLGYRLLQRLAGDVEELGFVESQPKQDGRNMIMVIGPHKRKPDAKAERSAPRGSRAAAPETAPRAQAAESAPRPVAESAPRPVAELTPRPVAESAPRPAAESAPRPAAESAPRPAAESAPRPAAESAPRPAAPRPGPRPAAPADRPGPRPAAPADRPVPSPRPPRTNRPGHAVAAAKPAGNGADAATGT